MSSGTPLPSGAKISHIESTKLSEVLWQQSSEGWNGKSAHVAVRRASIARCEPTTPFGRPVDPEERTGKVLPWAVGSARVTNASPAS